MKSSFHIIDRRSSPKGKNLPNRKRFIKRAKKYIQDNLKNLKKGINDTAEETVTIDTEGIEEPNFHFDGNTGHWDYVLPGNKHYRVGDTIPKENNSGNGKGYGGDGEDQFSFSVSNNEYLDLIFDDLELPNFVKHGHKSLTNFKWQRSGYCKTGSANNIALVKTFKNSIGRKIATLNPINKELEELYKHPEINKNRIVELIESKKKIAYLDPIDVRFKRYAKIETPITQAVMFCLMDVSGSMDQNTKDIAKRFFLLTYLFLKKKYQKIDLVFIRHTDYASEVNEEEFFYSRVSGGTKISSGTDLIQQIIKDRYPIDSWNIYGIQATDGDNAEDDNDSFIGGLETLLPSFQYYVYVEINEPYESMNLFKPTALFSILQEFGKSKPNLNIIRIQNMDDVVRAFIGVFSKNDQKI